jgi:hypothetical protein
LPIYDDADDQNDADKNDADIPVQTIVFEHDDADQIGEILHSRSMHRRWRLGKTNAASRSCQQVPIVGARTSWLPRKRPTEL